MQTLTEVAVRQFVQEWYEALDRHDPIDDMLPYLASNGLVLRFPDATVRSHDDFRDWYEDVTSRFFDEVHELRKVEVRMVSPVHADLSTVVNWQARAWQPPAARSSWLGFETYRTCSVVLQAGAVRIRRYGVDDMAPMPGSASL
jgi:SnoaL-like domain